MTHLAFAQRQIVRWTLVAAAVLTVAALLTQQSSTHSASHHITQTQAEWTNHAIFDSMGPQELALQKLLQANLERKQQLNAEAQLVKIDHSKSILLTREQLALHNGSDATMPIYLSIRKRIYDVTLGRQFYAPGQSYAYLSGREVARGFINNCYDSQAGQTHDLRGLNKQQLAVVNSWSLFYAERYRLVGYLIVPKLDKSSPLPNDECPEQRDGRFGRLPPNEFLPGPKHVDTMSPATPTTEADAAETASESVKSKTEL